MKILTALALVALVVLSGCGVSEKTLVGKWTGKINLSEKDRGMPGAAEAEKLAIDLDLREDKTFVMLALGVPSEGTWAYADENLTLTTTKVSSMDVSGSPNSARSLKVSDRGRTLTMANPGGSGTTVVFTRAES